LALEEEYGIKKTGTTATVGSDYQSKLRFYLNCIAGCGLEIPSKLKDYKGSRLSRSEEEQLVDLCQKLPPSLLDGLLWFRVPPSSPILDGSVNQFWEISKISTLGYVNINAEEAVLIGGQEIKRAEIMFYSDEFVSRNYTSPLNAFRDARRAEQRRIEDEDRRRRQRERDEIERQQRAQRQQDEHNALIREIDSRCWCYRPHQCCIPFIGVVVFLALIMILLVVPKIVYMPCETFLDCWECMIINSSSPTCRNATEITLDPIFNASTVLQEQILLGILTPTYAALGAFNLLIGSYDLPTTGYVNLVAATTLLGFSDFSNGYLITPLRFMASLAASLIAALVVGCFNQLTRRRKIPPSVTIGFASGMVSGFIISAMLWFYSVLQDPWAISLIMVGTGVVTSIGWGLIEHYCYVRVQFLGIYFVTFPGLFYYLIPIDYAYAHSFTYLAYPPEYVYSPALFGLLLVGMLMIATVFNILQTHCIQPKGYNIYGNVIPDESSSDATRLVQLDD